MPVVTTPCFVDLVGSMSGIPLFKSTLRAQLIGWNGSAEST